MTFYNGYKDYIKREIFGGEYHLNFRSYAYCWIIILIDSVYLRFFQHMNIQNDEKNIYYLTDYKYREMKIPNLFSVYF